MEYTAEQLSLRGRAMAYARWSRTPDRAAAMAPAWRGQFAAWERKVDPAGMLPPALRATLAEAARRAHMLEMRLKQSLATPPKPKTSAAALQTVCSWCHPRTAGKSHHTCPRHDGTLDQQIAAVRARHADDPELLARAARLAAAA